ncbi:MAG: metal ABC transporter permease [Thermodesulfovibrionales bacterium]|nr:metal ABC transporter permease [Thermodesulfovibrionales bacterium]
MMARKLGKIIFVFASLIIPALIGLISARRIGMIFFVSCIASALCVMIGLFLSFTWDLPSGPTIVGIYSLLFILSFLLRLWKT